MLVDVTLGAPVNGIIDLAGPERFRFEEIIRHFLSATQDTRQVVIDTHARYFSAKLDEQSLIPRGNSHIGAPRFKGCAEPAMNRCMKSQTDLRKNKVRKILHRNIKNSKKIASFLTMKLLDANH